LEFLQLEAVELDKEAKDAVDAIRLAGDLLVQTNKVNAEYVDAMVKNYRDIGPYIVIAPSIAIPHARPENGVQKTGISLLRLSDPIEFGHESNDPVKLVCAIAATDQSSHLEMLKKISQVLGNKAKLEAIMNSKDKKDIVALFQS
jgi:mannitol/fructose-specific phosphotransferase system IIA component (Ntr-type)